MAAAEPPPPSGTGGFFGMLSFRRSATAVASFDPAQEDELLALGALQSHVTDRLAALLLSSSSSQSQPLLSISFLSKLLDAIASSSDAFRDVLAVGPVAAALSRPPADRLAADLLDRSVKALDVLNAASLTLASLRGAHRAAHTAASCILGSPAALHRAQFARARRAIARIFPLSSLPGDDTNHDSSSSSFCSSSSRVSMRALSSRNWSAGGRHIHMVPPLALAAASAGAGSGLGLGLALYTTSSVLAFAMWALLAAVPCQGDRATINPPVAPSKQAQWAGPMATLQDRIAEEWKHRENKGAGLLAEMQALERAARHLNNLLDEQEAQAQASEEVTERAEELAAACRALEEGLAPLERQVRAVFHRVVACRAELVRCIDKSTVTTNVAAAPQHHSF